MPGENCASAGCCAGSLDLGEAGQYVGKLEELQRRQEGTSQIMKQLCMDF